jgi:hypothetical protein
VWLKGCQKCLNLIYNCLHCNGAVSSHICSMSIRGCSRTQDIRMMLFYFRHLTTHRWKSGSYSNTTNMTKHSAPGPTVPWQSSSCRRPNASIDTAVSAHGEIIPLRRLHSDSRTNGNKWQLVGKGKDRRNKERLRQLYDWIKTLLLSEAGDCQEWQNMSALQHSAVKFALSVSEGISW